MMFKSNFATPALRRGQSRRWLPTAVLAWLALVAAGMASLWAHTLTPGAAAPISGWKPASRQPRAAAAGPTLVMWCHPRCPCTRASLEQLDELARRCGQGLSVEVRFVRPPGCSAEWVQGPLWHRAEEIPGAWVTMDDGGREARSLGVKTSGQALLFSRTDALLFSGGLTEGRGHAGESAGMAAALRLARAGEGALRTAPVYGCSLLGADAREDAAGKDGTR